MTLRKFLLWGVAIAVAVAAALAYSCSERKAGEREAQEKADREAAEQRVRDNRRWADSIRVVLDSADRDHAASLKRQARADSIADARKALPLPRADAFDSSAAVQWRDLYFSANAEIADLRGANADLMRAAARLRPAARGGAARVDSTTLDLEKALERERMKGRFRIGLGLSLPKPPKVVAGLLGCAAGTGLALLATQDPDRKGGNALKGCGIGGGTAVIVTPTD